MVPDFGPMFEAIKFLAIGSLIFWPLGLWKAIEIVLWLTHHISWN